MGSKRRHVARPLDPTEVRSVGEGGRHERVAANRPLIRALESSLLIVIALYAVLFLAVALVRIGYPYELEWIEGGSLQHVQRILDGLPLYTEPSLDWTPLLYTPLFYIVSAGIVALFGEGFAPLRAVSLTATLGTAAILLWMLKRETRSWIVGFVAGGFWLAGFRTVGSWLDVGRVDPLFILFLVLTVALLRFGGSVRTAMLAGACAWLAYLSKQTAIGIIAPLALWLLWTQRRRGLAFAATTSITICGTILLWDLASDGWYRYYTLSLAPRHPIESRYWIEFWTKDLLLRAPIAIVFAASFVVWLCREVRRSGVNHGAATAEDAVLQDSTGVTKGIAAGTRRRASRGAETTTSMESKTEQDVLRILRNPRALYVVLAVGCLAASWVSRLHGGGWYNVLMPAYLAITIGFGLGYESLTRHSARLAHRVLIVTAALVQFLLVAYNPFQEMPSRADRATGDRVVATLRRAPGDVWVPEHPYLAERAGKGKVAHAAALLDILRIPGAESDSFRVQLYREVQARGFVAVMLNNALLLDLVGDSFERAPDVIRDATFWPVVGIKIRPGFLFVRSEDVQSEDVQSEDVQPEDVQPEDAAGVSVGAEGAGSTNTPDRRSSAGGRPQGPSPFYRTTEH